MQVKKVQEAVQKKEANRGQGARREHRVEGRRRVERRQEPEGCQNSPRGALMRPAPRPAWQNLSSENRLKRARECQRLPDHQKRLGDVREKDVDQSIQEEGID